METILIVSLWALINAQKFMATTTDIALKTSISPMVVTLDRDGIVSYIKQKSIENGVDYKVALTIVEKESRFNPDALGDNGKSRGLWQIHKPSHPDISDEQAFDVQWSTDWSMKQLAEGNCRIWSTCPLIDRVLK